jgi:hypothetical protein
MTTQFKIRVSALIASMFIISNSFAQTSSVNDLQSFLNDKNSVKKYENVVEKFQKKFADAENTRWEKIRNNYLVKFSQGDLEKRALLSPKGNLIYEISYGTEKHVPADIRKNVKRIYIEYAISTATLIEEANRKIWVINLEDDENYAIVRIENDEIEEVKKYQKAIPTGTGK